MKKMLLTLCIIFLIIGGINIKNGFDKKDNYYNSENYSSLNKNVYVGGDAYNYIINGNYFTGYIVLGSCFILLSGMTGCTALLLPETTSKNNQITYEGINPSKNIE